MTVILNWNSLPADTVNAKTVNGFKNTFDRNYHNNKDTGN